MSATVAIATLVIVSAGWPESAVPAAAAQPVPEPGYREGGQIGGGGAAEPASSAGTVTFLISTVAVVAVITGGVLFSRRQRPRDPAGPTEPSPADRTADSEEQPTP